MVSFPIVDTHLHVWDPSLINYSWLQQKPILNKPHLLEDYDARRGTVDVDKMIFVQCEADFSEFMKEAEWVMGLAAKDPRIQGIVPWAPLEKGRDARKDLDKLAQSPLVKGIRRIIEFEENPTFCLQPDFIDGVRMLESFNLHFEICVQQYQLPNAIKMVEQCPNVRFILDHIGKPDIKDRVLEPWKTNTKTLAGMPNVWCKMSGLVVEADMQNWTREDLKPYINHILDVFGFDRTMFGGDWPVVLQAAEIPQWVEALEWAIEGCSQDEKRKLFRESAIAFYRLPE